MKGGVKNDGAFSSKCFLHLKLKKKKAETFYDGREVGKELSAKIYFGPEFVTSSKTKSGSVLLSKNVRTMTHAATKPAGWF